MEGRLREESLRGDLEVSETDGGDRAANVHFLLLPLVVERKQHRLALRGGIPLGERGEEGEQDERVGEVGACVACRKRISAGFMKGVEEKGVEGVAGSFVLHRLQREGRSFARLLGRTD